jgi:hypothetical protein
MTAAESPSAISVFRFEDEFGLQVGFHMLLPPGAPQTAQPGAIEPRTPPYLPHEPEHQTPTGRNKKPHRPLQNETCPSLPRNQRRPYLLSPLHRSERFTTASKPAPAPVPHAPQTPPPAHNPQSPHTPPQTTPSKPPQKKDKAAPHAPDQDQD